MTGEQVYADKVKEQLLKLCTKTLGQIQKC
jgi:hypothetical protein